MKNLIFSSAVVLSIALSNTMFVMADTSKNDLQTKSRESANFAIDPLYDTGMGFIGAEIGVGGIGDLSAGILGGYQYYFKEAWQFAGFRQGIRGIVSIDWSRYGYSYLRNSYNYNALFAQVGADWTLEFTPRSNFVWGVFIGLSLGYFKVFSNDSFFVSPSAFIWSGNAGASLTMHKNHRIDLAFGSGTSIFAFRYLFMF